MTRSRRPSRRGLLRAELASPAAAEARAPLQTRQREPPCPASCTGSGAHRRSGVLTQPSLSWPQRVSAEHGCGPPRSGPESLLCPPHPTVSCWASFSPLTSRLLNALGAGAGGCASPPPQRAGAPAWDTKQTSAVASPPPGPPEPHPGAAPGGFWAPVNCSPLGSAFSPITHRRVVMTRSPIGILPL